MAEVTMEQKIEFYQAIVDVSVLIEQETNGEYLAKTHMVQAANETGYYAEGCWRGINGWKGKKNLTGISPNGTIADFASWADYAKAFVSVITTNGFGYPHILDMGKEGVVPQIEALGASKWNVNHYLKNGVLGGLIIEYWNEDYKLIDQVVSAYDEAHQSKPKPDPEETKETAIATSNVKSLETKLTQMSNSITMLKNDFAEVLLQVAKM